MMAMTIFKRVLDIIRINIGHFKGESPGSPDSIELDIVRLKAAHRNELVVQGHNKIFSSRRRLI